MRCSRSASRGDALAVAPELRIVRREELQPRERPLAEILDHATVAEDPVHVPVRRDRPQVHDLHVTLGRDLLLDLFGLHRHVGQGSGGRGSAMQRRRGRTAGTPERNRPL